MVLGMAVYGYARCSTNESKQDIDRQKRELKEQGVPIKNIYFEYESGTKTDRAELTKLLDTIKQGDTLVVTEVSRLSRSTQQLCEIINHIKDYHIKLIIGSIVLDCTKDDIEPMTLGMLQMMSVFSEMERNIISQRVKSGMANAKAKGSKIGRPVITADKIPSKFMKYYPLLKQNIMNVSEVAKVTDMSRTTIYKYMEILGDK